MTLIIYDGGQKYVLVLPAGADLAQLWLYPTPPPLPTHSSTPYLTSGTL